MTLATAFAFVVLLVSIIWAWAGVELLTIREEICWADGLFFLINVSAFNFAVWA
jgi:hypothetical protein